MTLRITILICGLLLTGCSEPKPVKPVRQPVTMQMLMPATVANFATVQIRTWKDTNGCTWSVFAGRTNGPSCPVPARTNLTFAWDAVNNRHGIPIVILQSNDLFHWQQITSVPATSTKWTAIINPQEKQMFWQLK